MRADSTLARVSHSEREKIGWPSTIILMIGAIYCLLPILWVIMASTKSTGELFSTFTFAPSGNLWTNVFDLSVYRGGLYWRWMLNSAIYAIVGAVVSTLLSAMAGYGLSKFDFPGKQVAFNILLIGVLVPGVVLAIPQYLLFAKIGLTNSMWSVLLPSIISPYSIYLARVYAGAAVPRDVIEAGMVDGARPWRIFSSLALPMMLPGLVTIFLFQFVAIWNNYMLPFIMLGNDSLFPITLGLSSFVSLGSQYPAMYSLTICGSLLSIVPLVALFLVLQRYWRVDLAAGAVKA